MNGCGGKGSWFKPPYAVMFEACCNKHDELYEKGGNRIDRKIADVYLLEYIKQDVRRLYSEGVLNILGLVHFHIWAYIYYIGVRIGGKQYFNYKTKK